MHFTKSLIGVLALALPATADFFLTFLTCSASSDFNGYTWWDHSYAVSTQGYSCGNLMNGRNGVVEFDGGALVRNENFGLSNFCGTNLDLYPNGNNAYRVYYRGGNSAVIGNCVRNARMLGGCSGQSSLTLQCSTGICS